MSQHLSKLWASCLLKEFCPLVNYLGIFYGNLASLNHAARAADSELLKILKGWKAEVNQRLFSRESFEFWRKCFRQQKKYLETFPINVFEVKGVNEIVRVRVFQCVWERMREREWVINQERKLMDARLSFQLNLKNKIMEMIWVAFISVHQQTVSVLWSITQT